MKARCVGVFALVGSVVAGIATTAGAQPVQPVPSKPPTTQTLLRPLDAVAGQSIAQGINNPDAPYAPEFPAQGLGADGTAGSFERSTRLDSGHLTSGVIVDFGDTRGTATVNVNLCPDPGGSVNGNVAIAIGSGSELEGNRRDQTATARFTGRVDDGANLTESSVATTGSNNAERQALKRFAEQALRNAEKAWRSGYCVRIEVLEGASRAVKPREVVAVSAKAVQRFDGSTINKPMTATLSGEKKIQPGTSAETPANFTYTAPNRSPGRGDVTLKSVSRRGIGTEKLHYVAGQDLKIEAAIGPARFSALKCGGPVGAWELHVVADFGGVSSDETIGFTLSEDLTGPVSAGGIAFGPPGQVGTSGSGRATYDPVAKTLTISPGGSVPVTEGDFCE